LQRSSVPELASRTVAGARELRPAQDHGSHAPRIVLLDAAAAGISDPARLRVLARSICEQDGATHCSRSYRFPFALIACHHEPVGIDIERVERCDQVFAQSILTPSERVASARAARRSHAALGTGGDEDRRITSLWSSKEALSKALGDALAYDPRRLEGPACWRDGRSGPWRASALDLGAGYVGWVCWRAS
jgi:hypothetical protein